MGRYGSIDVTVLGDRVRLTLRGEIDAGLDADVQRALDSVEPTGTVVEVDARRVTFMDGYGLRLLSRLTGRTGRVVLLEPPQIIRFLLEVTGLLEDLRIVSGPLPGKGGAGGALIHHRPPDQLIGARAGAPASAPSPTTQRM
ncbi:STAS domain-containing protein [Georgenia sp. 10Sc9-8]|uniref:STAS domain-containing protein n=1 Tax=Georgenia halotolerans TaxID=3028317 RepID=A0ABT5TVS3_9MICO|nr:STAS domain-containing protein [Georgenia halotolerans]